LHHALQPRGPRLVKLASVDQDLRLGCESEDAFHDGWGEDDETRRVPFGGVLGVVARCRVKQQDETGNAGNKPGRAETNEVRAIEQQPTD
jgi:hypothetical protein